MKKLLFMLTFSVIISSCSNDDENQVSNEFVGRWQLIETYSDPGDGSGLYEPIDSEKSIEFFANGTFKMNGPLCGLSTVMGDNITGTIGASENSQDSILISNEECEYNNSDAEYIIGIENSYLIIYWTACIEGCSQKYQKL